jgi:hypothetical protein
MFRFHDAILLPLNRIYSDLLRYIVLRFGKNLKKSNAAFRFSAVNSQNILSALKDPHVLTAGRRANAKHSTASRH